MVNSRFRARAIRERLDMHCFAGFDVGATLEDLSLFVSVAVEQGSSGLAPVLLWGER